VEQALVLDRHQPGTGLGCWGWAAAQKCWHLVRWFNHKKLRFSSSLWWITGWWKCWQLTMDSFKRAWILCWLMLVKPIVTQLYDGKILNYFFWYVNSIYPLVISK
jgi:hypothetical protein